MKIFVYTFLAGKNAKPTTLCKYVKKKQIYNYTTLQVSQRLTNF